MFFLALNHISQKRSEEIYDRHHEYTRLRGSWKNGQRDHRLRISITSYFLTTKIEDFGDGVFICPFIYPRGNCGSKHFGFYSPYDTSTFFSTKHKAYKNKRHAAIMKLCTKCNHLRTNRRCNCFNLPKKKVLFAAISQVLPFLLDFVIGTIFCFYSLPKAVCYQIFSIHSSFLRLAALSILF